MTLHEFGKSDRPVFVLLSGMGCYWRGNFGGVIDELVKDFLVVCVGYTGFDNGSEEVFADLQSETEKIESALSHRYGAVHVVYGSEMGAQICALLAGRGKLNVQYFLLGSPDFQKENRLQAFLEAVFLTSTLFPFLKNGEYKNQALQKQYDNQLRSADPYPRAYARLIGRDQSDFAFLSRKSLRNQIYSMRTASLPKKVRPDCARVTVFWPREKSEESRREVLEVFPDANLVSIRMRPEEMLAVYPEKWLEWVRGICLAEGNVEE